MFPSPHRYHVCLVSVTVVTIEPKVVLSELCWGLPSVWVVTSITGMPTQWQVGFVLPVFLALKLCVTLFAPCLLTSQLGRLREQGLMRWLPLLRSCLHTPCICKALSRIPIVVMLRCQVGRHGVSQWQQELQPMKLTPYLPTWHLNTTIRIRLSALHMVLEPTVTTWLGWFVSVDWFRSSTPWRQMLPKEWLSSPPCVPKSRSCKLARFGDS